MNKTVLIASALVTFGASAALAAGINLSWDDCGVNGSQDKTFSCTTNLGSPFTAIGSFVPTAGVNEYLGFEARIDISTSSPTLPDWWRHGTGACRGGAGLSVNFDVTSGPFSCQDAFAGQAAGSFVY